MQPNRQAEPMALSEDLVSVTAELAEVKQVLRDGSAYLGMSGTLLQEYFIELSKKDNLLRLGLSRVSTVVTSKSIRECDAVAEGQPLRRSKRRSKTLSPSYGKSLGAGLLGDAAPQTSPNDYLSVEAQPPQVALQPVDQHSPASPSKLATNVAEAKVALVELLSAASPSMSSPGGKDEDAASTSDVELDSSNLAGVLEVLDSFPHDARIQRLGMKAIGRLARDKAQLRPLCLATIWAVRRCINNFQSNVGLSRLSVTALGNLAYMPEVATLIAHEALPALFSAMVTHAEDEKLQGLVCEALARLMQVGELVVVKEFLEAMLSHADVNVVDVCCKALSRLHDGGICRSNQILDVLLPLSESRPAELRLQQRAASAAQRLVHAGTISEVESRSRAPSLLNAQWAQLLARFVGADGEEAESTTRFHADVQTVFHEEVVKHFEYEAAERSLHLHQRRAPGTQRLLEVVRCLVENLEDYHGRLEARELAWDPSQKRLIPLDKGVREELCAKALVSMEVGLIESLQAVATAESAQSEGLLAIRTGRLRSDCAALLQRKTQATQVHQECTRLREVMLFEAVEHLELRASVDVSKTQIRSALHMVEMVESITPPEAVERLRARLDHLAKGLQPEVLKAVPAG